MFCFVSCGKLGRKSEEEEKLENDEDLFEDLSPQMSQLSHSKWKFIGDCAWLMPTDGPDGNMIVNNTEADGRPSRKRYRIATFDGNDDLNFRRFVMQIQMKSCSYWHSFLPFLMVQMTRDRHITYIRNFSSISSAI